jgi:hypothetical protein
MNADPGTPTSDDSTSWHITPLGGLRSRYEGAPPSRIVHGALIGGVDLDLSACDVPAGGLTVVNVSLAGGVKVKAPPGVRVELGGFSLLGGQRVESASSAAGAPVLRARSFGIFGGTRVHSTATA